MTEKEVEHFRAGYDECRQVLMSDIKRALNGPNPEREIEIILEGLEADVEREYWEVIQKEQPGITRDEYEAQLNQDMERIRAAFYSKAGYLKPRLVKNVDKGNTNE